MRRSERIELTLGILVSIAFGLAAIAPVIGGGNPPVDANDEAAHTFVSIPLFFRALFQGELLKIHLGENFGVPLLGDPIACPWAPHALSYVIFDSPVMAMLWNRFWIAALTVGAMIAFYRRRMGFGAAVFCSSVGFASPSLYNFLHYHPHQGARLYFTLSILALESLAASSTALRFLVAAAALASFLLGVGTNGAILGIPFLAGFSFFLARERKNSGVGMRLAAAALPGTALVLPQALAFLSIAPLTARIRLPYSQSFHVPPVESFVSLFVPGELGGVFYGLAVQPSIWLWILVGVGLLDLLRRRRPESALIALALGALPAVAVLLFRLLPKLHDAIPYVGTTNPVRALWFSDLFLMTGAGAGIPKAWAWSRGRRARRLAVLALLSIVVAERSYTFVHQTSQTQSSEYGLTYRVSGLLRSLKGPARLATNDDPVPLALESRATLDGLLGSGGRSIILHEGLKSKLLAEGLIRLGARGHSYAIEPAAPERLARLGIRWYVLTSYAGGELSLPGGWIDMKDEATVPLKVHAVALSDRAPIGRSAMRYRLFENPLRPTPFLVDGTPPVFLEEYRMDWNGMEVSLPAARQDYEVVATFTAWPGWKAWIDGREVPVEKDPYSFIKVRVRSGRRLQLEYEPFSDRQLVLSAFAAVALAFAGAALSAPRRALGG